MKLRIAEDLALPVDVVTQTIAILAKRRAGKSYTMRRLVEQLHEASQQVVLIDPKGDQWGIRSSADGKGPGLPFVIIGGERGDVPLEVGSGAVVAKLVVEERVSCVLDLSLLRKNEVATFMGGTSRRGGGGHEGFLEVLYRMKAVEKYRTPMMLVIDEADAIAPQKAMPGEERMLGAAEDIVRRGGQRGIGCTLVTQRSAVLNKNVLTQAQILMALRTIAPQDLKAMDAWIDVHGTIEERKTLMDSLPALPVGDAWVWSPGWPTTSGIFKRVHVLPIETFDSGATPAPGARRVEPKTVADVDLEALQRQMAETIQRAKADDPNELRKQIRELKAEVAKRVSAPANIAVPAPKAIEKCVLKDGQLARAEKLLERMDAAAVKFSEFEEDLRVTAKEIRDAIASTQNPHATTQQRVSAPTGAYRSAVAADHSPGRGAVPAATASRPAPRVSTGPGVEMKGMHRAMLTALAQHPDGLSKKKILIHTGYASSGPVSTAFADLVREGWAVSTGHGLTITEEGLKALGSYDPLPVGDELREWLLAGDKLSTMEKALLKAVCDAYPHSIRKGEVLERTGYASSGPVSSAFAKLVGLGYVTSQGPSVLKATDELFS